MQAVKISANAQADVWTGVNLRGSLKYLIKTRDALWHHSSHHWWGDSASFWWIKWGLGSVEQLGVLNGSGSLPIPAWLNVASKLRCQAVSDTVVYISDSAEIDHTLNFHW